MGFGWLFFLFFLFSFSPTARCFFPSYLSPLLVFDYDKIVEGIFLYLRHSSSLTTSLQTRNWLSILVTLVASLMNILNAGPLRQYMTDGGVAFCFSTMSLLETGEQRCIKVITKTTTATTLTVHSYRSLLTVLLLTPVLLTALLLTPLLLTTLLLTVFLLTALLLTPLLLPTLLLPTFLVTTLLLTTLLLTTFLVTTLLLTTLLLTALLLTTSTQVVSDCGLTEGIICEREQPQRGFTCPGVDNFSGDHFAVDNFAVDSFAVDN